MGKNVTNCAMEICFLTYSIEGRKGGVQGGKREAFHRQVQAIFAILKLLQKLYLIIQGTGPCSHFHFIRL